MSKEASEAQKHDWIAAQLEPWRDAVAPLRAVGEMQRLGYRDRACLSAEWEGGRWSFGLRRRDMLIAIPDCPIHSERVRGTARLLADILPGPPSFPLVHLVQSGAQVTLILKGATPPDPRWLDEAVMARLEALGVEGLWLHLFPSVGRRIFAKNGWYLLWGQPRSVDPHGLVHGPTAFAQLLPSLFTQALEEATAFLHPGPGDSVVDLYCGTGTTLRRWMGRSARCVGVELSAEAIACAQENAPGACVLRGSCTARIPQIAAWLGQAPVGGEPLLHANPPRTGLESPVREWIGARGRPARMTYLSCSAGTLRRDLDRLVAAGYVVEGIVPFDFFPQTYHVETLVMLRSS